MSTHAEEIAQRTAPASSPLPRSGSRCWRMTGVEVLLAYEQVPTLIMLTVLLGLSIIKAALIIAYFMHLKFERLSLFLTLFPDADFLHRADADLPGRRGAHSQYEAARMKRCCPSRPCSAALSLPAGAQCVMCYRTAHAQNRRALARAELGI